MNYMLVVAVVHSGVVPFVYFQNLQVDYQEYLYLFPHYLIYYLLFQIVFYSQLSTENSIFDFADVVDGICQK